MRARSIRALGRSVVQPSDDIEGVKINHDPSGYQNSHD